MKFQWNTNVNLMEIKLKFQCNTNGNPLGIQLKFQWNTNENPVKISLKYQWKSIENSIYIYLVIAARYTRLKLIKKNSSSHFPFTHTGSPFSILTGFFKMTGADGERFCTGAFTRGLLVALGSGQSWRILVLLCYGRSDDNFEIFNSTKL